MLAAIFGERTFQRVFLFRFRRNAASIFAVQLAIGNAHRKLVLELLALRLLTNQFLGTATIIHTPAVPSPLLSPALQPSYLTNLFLHLGPQVFLLLLFRVLVLDDSEHGLIRDLLGLLKRLIIGHIAQLEDEIAQGLFLFRLHCVVLLRVILHLFHNLVRKIIFLLLLLLCFFERVELSRSDFLLHLFLDGSLEQILG